VKDLLLFDLSVTRDRFDKLGIRLVEKYSTEEYIPSRVKRSVIGYSSDSEKDT
jgi:hypothetical protein